MLTVTPRVAPTVVGVIAAAAWGGHRCGSTVIITVTATVHIKGKATWNDC